MKRPEGFDRSKGAAPTVTAPAPKAGSAKVGSTAVPEKRSSKVSTLPRLTTEREAKAHVRSAARERKSFEKHEIKRFTRRARARRNTVIAFVLVIGTLVAGVGIATFSPLLSLEKITIVGATRLDPVALHDAIDDQLGTPLALVNFGTITEELEKFPLVRSYTTEAVPPHELVVTIVERAPIGVVSDGSRFAIVDPAGIVVESVSERPAGLPLIKAGEASVGNKGFAATIAVLLALPPDLLARVDTIEATTKDDVVFSLAGGLQSVRWGSADKTALKARVLATLVPTQNQAARLLYDVSAPEAPVVHSL